MNLNFGNFTKTKMSDTRIPLFALSLACFISIFVLPLFPTDISWLKVLLFSIIIALATFSISTKAQKFIVVAFVAIILEWITRTSDYVIVHYIAELISNLYIIWLVGHFVIQIMQREEVTIYTLLEALNGYLLLGIMFISLVYFVDLNIPGSYTGAESYEMDLGYYALVTLTTTGYGDIAPITPIAKTLALLIAIAGQFYVAVIVAILVGKYSSKS